MFQYIVHDTMLILKQPLGYYITRVNDNELIMVNVECLLLFITYRYGV